MPATSPAALLSPLSPFVTLLLGAFPQQRETKMQKLLDGLGTLWRQNQNEKIVIFATYLGTVDMIANLRDPMTLADTVRQAVFMMRVGHPDIDIELSIGEDPMPARFDRRLVSQALTNIIKNGTEAISALPDGSEKGRIDVSANRDAGEIHIDVVDNGIGLPKEHRSRLLEPYVTTREKGTGLGLAIVGKILEEHGGGIELHDASEKVPGRLGAWIRLRFAVNPPQPSGTSSSTDEKSRTASSVT
jgi:two-component system nitrogen regulation sensor histidine kinase NtrY